MEGETHYRKIIGGSKEDKSLAKKELQDAFDSKSVDFTDHEIKKTPEDLEIIKRTEIIVDRIVSKYGGEAKSLPIEKIYILEPGSVGIITKGKHAGGLHKPWGLKIGAEKGESKLLFASILAHELFHLKSFKSARIKEPEEGAWLYRSGLWMVDTKDPKHKNGKAREYFGIMEEAIVSECTKKFVEEISLENDFTKESEASRKFINWIIEYYRRINIPEDKIKESVQEIKYIPNSESIVESVMNSSEEEEKRQAYAAGMFEAIYKDNRVEIFERYYERKKLYDLLDKIVLNSKGKFKTREEIFDEFAKANFSGNYIPLARIVEEILGEGSFRKLAEDFSISHK